MGPTYEELLITIENLKNELADKCHIEKALSESEERFRSLVESISDTVILQDSKGITMYVSPRVKELSGYEPDFFRGNPVPENIIYPDDFELYTNAIQKLTSTFAPITVEYRLNKLSGGTIWVRHSAKPIYSDGNITGIYHFLQDITREKKEQEERMKMEKELSNAQILMQAAFDQSPVPMVVAAYPDFTFKIINKATEDFLLVDASNYYNKTPMECDWNWKEFMPDGSPVLSVAELPLPLALQGIISKNKEMYIVRHDGSVVWELISGAPIYNAEGELIAGIIAMVDITERKKTEQILKEDEIKLKEQNEEYLSLNEELTEANNQLNIAKQKAEESDILKTAFLQNMSHEIRTPMNSIIGFSDLLNDEHTNEEQRKGFTTIIQNSCRQLLSIVEEVLTISSLETKQEKINIQITRVNNILTDLETIFNTQAKSKGISLLPEHSLSDEQSEIYTDKTKLTQILTNLITNAVKFTHAGSVGFGYYLVEPNEPANNSAKPYLSFYVRDSGIGIKEEMQEKIFERFRQADKSIHVSYGGAGLGLSISKAFVELLGGKIWVHSEVGQGSTFYFTIPYEPVQREEEIITPVKRFDESKTILVAEDEEYNFLFIRELLFKLYYNVIHAKDGKEALEICKTNPNIDLILMDIKMPNLNGQEAAGLIKAFRPELPIIAQTAYAMQQEKDRYNGIYFDEYLTKPIDAAELKQKILKFM